MKVQLAGREYTTFVNGPGCRSVVFFSGCKHACNECHNKEFWSYNYGQEVDIKELVKSIGVYYDAHLIQGVTISGGEPFDQPKALEELIDRLIIAGITDIWVYTGYLYEEARSISQDIINKISVLVDGKFDINQKDDQCRYKGSSNQRIIDCKKTEELRAIMIKQELNDKYLINYKLED